ncbi:hypothetical protein MDA_GLEAN10018854 [Myotis davidii]|uniref:Uncharacterized protein n=1 Tax=Myotis davidii TaxID=225400 RepID=L5M8V4_MYODS|nr:hypothetical protein MDA_GLEAN10018854 [Myotis davidii]
MTRTTGRPVAMMCIDHQGAESQSVKYIFLKKKEGGNAGKAAERGGGGGALETPGAPCRPQVNREGSGGATGVRWTLVGSPGGEQREGSRRDKRGGPHGREREGRANGANTSPKATQKRGRNRSRIRQGHRRGRHAQRPGRRAANAQAHLPGRCGGRSQEPEGRGPGALPMKPAPGNGLEAPPPGGTRGCWATGAGAAGGSMLPL